MIYGRLGRGSIQHNKLEAAPVLVISKKGSNLQNILDHRLLNVVTLKNKYRKPSTIELLEIFLNVNKYTKLGKENTYGNLKVSEGKDDKMECLF